MHDFIVVSNIKDTNCDYEKSVTLYHNAEVYYFCVFCYLISTNKKGF